MADEQIQQYIELPCGHVPQVYRRGLYWGAFCYCGDNTGATWLTPERAIGALDNIITLRMKWDEHDRVERTHSEP